MMEPGTIAIVVALIGNFGVMAGAWLDTRRRTNGNGPLYQKLDAIETRVRHVETGIARLEGKVER